MGAARRWARGAAPQRTSDDVNTVLDAAQRFEMDAESIAALRAVLDATPDDGTCEVWECNWPIVEAFLAVSSQWRMTSIGGGMAPVLPVYVGLDYSAARVGLDAAGIEVTPGLWSGLRVMEAAACAALNEA